MQFFWKHLHNNKGDENVSKLIWIVIAFVIGALLLSTLSIAFKTDGTVGGWLNDSIESWFGEPENRDCSTGGSGAGGSGPSGAPEGNDKTELDGIILVHDASKGILTTDPNITSTNGIQGNGGKESNYTEMFSVSTISPNDILNVTAFLSTNGSAYNGDYIDNNTEIITSEKANDEIGNYFASNTYVLKTTSTTSKYSLRAIDASSVYIGVDNEGNIIIPVTSDPSDGNCAVLSLRECEGIKDIIFRYNPTLGMFTANGTFVDIDGYAGYTYNDVIAKLNNNYHDISISLSENGIDKDSTQTATGITKYINVNDSDDAEWLLENFSNENAIEMVSEEDFTDSYYMYFGGNTSGDFCFLMDVDEGYEGPQYIIVTFERSVLSYGDVLVWNKSENILTSDITIIDDLAENKNYTNLFTSANLTIGEQYSISGLCTLMFDGTNTECESIIGTNATAYEATQPFASNTIMLKTNTGLEIGVNGSGNIIVSGLSDFESLEEGKTTFVKYTMNTDNEIKLVPVNGTYYVKPIYTNNFAVTEYTNYTAKYTEGQALPKLSDGDVLVYGDYVYRYGWYAGNYTGSKYWFDKDLDGWSVLVKDTCDGSGTAISEISTIGNMLNVINGKPIVSLAWTFSECKKLKTAPSIPETVFDMQGTFSGCSALQTVSIPAQVSNINFQTFLNCQSLQGINVDANNPYYTTDANGALYNKNQTKLLIYPAGVAEKNILPSTITTIDQYAFSNSTDLSNVTIPNTITSLTFYNCTSLETAPKIPSAVKTLSFSGCKALKNLSTLPEGIENLSFNSCTSLKTIPNLPSTLKTISFYGCTALETIPEIPASVTNMDSAFYGCSSLTGDIIINSANVSSASSVLTNTVKNITIHVPADSTTYSKFAMFGFSMSNITIKTF